MLNTAHNLRITRQVIAVAIGWAIFIGGSVKLTAAEPTQLKSAIAEKIFSSDLAEKSLWSESDPATALHHGFIMSDQLSVKQDFSVKRRYKTMRLQSPSQAALIRDNPVDQAGQSYSATAPQSPRVAFAPHGYPSGYPGDVTDQGAPLGGNSAPVIVGEPIFVDPQFTPPGGQQLFVTPDGVVVDAPPEYRSTVETFVPKTANVKQGPLQRVEVQATYLPDLGDDGLQVLDLEHSFTIGLPFPDRDSPLLITPGFDVHLLSGDMPVDLPETLYDSYISVRWLRRVSDKILLNSSVAPGWYSDWQTNSTNALRAPAQSLVIYDYSASWQLIAGLVYLDRDDLKFLPALGVIYKPNERFRLEAVMPRPRIAWRVAASDRWQDWVSLSGEFGGGQWAVERADGREDILAARDYRIILGIERKSLVGNIGSRFEIGYVFGRTYEYRVSNEPDYEPGDTVLARAALVY